MGQNAESSTRVDEVAHVAGGVLYVNERGPGGGVVGKVYRRGPYSFPCH
jgi:hypothetical protein